MHVHVNGVRLYFDVEGAGLEVAEKGLREKPTLILLHGGPGADHTLYKPAFSALSDVAQVIYYDHRGNGRSEDGPKEAWNLDQWGDDVRGLCDALGVEKPIVLGTSFGGFVAQSYATRHPDHVGKLILVSTAAKMDFEQVFAAFGRLGGREAGEIARTYWTNPTSERRALYRDKCVPLYQVDMENMMAAMGRVIQKDDVALQFNGPNNAQGEMDFRADLAKISCPTLVMVGDRDPITPMAFSEEIARSIPPQLVTLECFANCGHGVIGDRGDAALARIRAFIEDA